MRTNHGWVVVAAGALMTCIAFGAVFSLAVFLQPMADTTGWSRAGISAAMTLVFLAMGAGGFAWGMLSDRFGARPVVFAGSVLLALGLVLASRAGSLLEFQLAYGLLVGFAAGSFFPPFIAVVSNWFDRHRALAVSLTTAGVGVAPLTMSPFASWLLTVQDWRGAQMTIGILVALVLVPASLLVRQPPALPAGAGAPAPGAGDERELSLGKALRSLPFIVLGLTYFACCAMHSGPIFHTISYAIFCGVPAMAAVSIYSLEGLAGLGGRVLFGLLGDRYGAKRVLIAGLLVQALAAGAFVFASRLSDFYATSFVFGLAYGGVMPLYAVLARGYFGPHIMGGVIGAASLVSSLGMALGPLAGGWIFDTFGTYSWLYVGSFAMGLGAVAIACAFPPMRLAKEFAHG
ncbi:MAG TPA: MFS transporter [Burkholderiales bacterium]|nr:MFS transporter [Burkholderiales bacterium]